MFPTAPTLFVVTLILAVSAIATFGFSLFWGVFALTLVITTIVAIHRSIPRKER